MGNPFVGLNLMIGNHLRGTKLPPPFARSQRGTLVYVNWKPHTLRQLSHGLRLKILSSSGSMARTKISAASELPRFLPSEKLSTYQHAPGPEMAHKQPTWSLYTPFAGHWGGPGRFVRPSRVLWVGEFPGDGFLDSVLPGKLRGTKGNLGGLR